MLDSISLEGLAALLALVLTLLTGLCGGAWWASAIYAKVGQLVREMQAINVQLSTSQADQRSINADIFEQIGAHGQRLTKVETKIGL